MSDAASILILVIFLATFSEWVMERFFSKLLDGQRMIYASAALGVLLCIVFRANAISLLGAYTPIGGELTGQIITGVVVGAGANKLHDFFQPKPSG